MELELTKQKLISKEMLKKVLCIFMAVLMISSSFSGTLNVFAAEIRALGSVTDGNITDGNVTDGNVTDGNVTGGNVTNGNIDISQIERIEVADIEIIEGTKLVTYYWGINDEGESEGTFRIYDIEPTKLTLVYKDGSKYTAKESKIEKKTGLYFSVEHDQWGNFDWETNTYPDTWWDVGEHKATAVLKNDGDVRFETEFTVTITETPIERIEVEPEEIIEGCLSHNDDGGYYLEPSFVTVYLKNGEKISGSLDEVIYELGYFAEVTTDKIKQNNGCVGKYIETLTYMNVSADFVVNIIESPIESIEIEPIEIIEHTHGWPDWNAGPDDQDAFCYTGYYLPDMGIITINFKDGTSISGTETDIYKATGYSFECSYYENDVDYCWSECSSGKEICPGHENWDIGEHKADISFMGFETEFTVRIVENPIESIEIDDFEKLVHPDAFDEDGYVYLNAMPENVTINFKNGTSVSGTIEELETETGYILSLGWYGGWAPPYFNDYFQEGENICSFYVWCCDSMKYSGDMASGPFFGTEYNVTVKLCEHTDTTYYPELPPTCKYSGYTEGTYCNDCEYWLEGRDWIDDDPPHVDENNDNLCDSCNGEIEENIFKKIEASVWAADVSNEMYNSYFDKHTQPEDDFVHWYLVYPGSGAFSDYYSEETWSYTIPYDDYIAIVDKNFTNHSDMKEYLSKEGYFTDNTHQILEFSIGGHGGGLTTDLLSVYENGDGTYTLQGVWADPYYNVREYFSSLTEGYDYYYYNTYRDDFGIIRKNWALIESAFEVTVIETEDGFKVDGYEESDYYIVNNELYHIQKNGSKVKYNEFSYDTGDGALVVDDGSGDFFEHKLTRFENNDSLWYIPCDTYTFKVEVEEGYEIVSIVLTDDNGEQILEEIYPGEYSITPVGNAHIEINSEWTGSTEHRHNYISSVTTPATCTTAGVKTFSCECGDSYTKEIPSTGHNETTLSAIPATCSSTGLTEGKKCSVCDEITVKQIETAKLPHTEETIKGYEATCNEKGLTDGVKCSVCDEILVAQTETEALGHNYTEEIIDAAHLVSEATYDSEAIYRYDCINCESVGTATFKHGEKLIRVSSVSVKTSTTINKGKTETLVATVQPANAANKNVTWESSNTKVVTVDANGKITAKAGGQATITVTTEEGKKTAQCKVTVNVPVTGISINKTGVSVVKGKTCQLNATVNPSDASNKNVTWSSSNTSVATVNSSGKVTAKAVGTSTITVKTKDGSKTATCKVTVTSGTISVTGVSLDKSSASVFVGKTLTLNATVKPKNATNKKMTWSSSNTSVATVDNSGKVTGKAKGTATITVKTTDGSKTAKCTITVNPYNENIKKTGQFTVGDKNYKQSVTFDANWLTESSYNYNHDLAQFCSQASLLAYSSVNEIRNGLSSLGFSVYNKDLSSTARKKVIYNKSNDCIVYWPDRKDSTGSKNNFVITKKDYTINGEKHTAVLVLLRGTNGNEWYSNFDSGTGGIHESFLAATKFVYGYLDDFLKKNNLLNNENVELIITGHSRGAAVANLLAWYIECTQYTSIGGGGNLINGNFKESYPLETNMFTYTFATPNVATKTQINKRSETGRGKSINNIFNFVNPEDFVTKCLPAPWSYGRYGVTLTLPSSTNESKKSYTTYYNGMNTYFKKYSGKSYAPYENGEAEVYDVLSEVTKNVISVNDYYNKKMKNTYATKTTLHDFFKDVLCPFVSGTASIADSVNAGLLGYSACLDLLACKTYRKVARFFFENEGIGLITDLASGAINKTYFYEKWNANVDLSVSETYFRHAHCAETYAAFLTSMNYDQAYTWAKGSYRAPYKHIVNCPVDIDVCDKDTDELVGRIVDNVVDEEVTSIVMYVEGDSKSFWLPSNGNYDVKLIGNDSGEMDYAVSAIDSDLGEIERINFLDVPVEEGFEYVGEFTEENISLDEYSLITELGETVEKTEKIIEDKFNTIDVSVNVEGLGAVNGDGAYTSGDYIVLQVVADENNDFRGWYEDDELISEELTLAFVVQENKTLTAKFTNVYVEATGLTISEESVVLDDSNENSYIMLDATLAPTNATKTSFNWKSSDESVVTVSESGFVQAVGCGTATITVSTVDGKLTETCTVTVKCDNHMIFDETIVVEATCTQEGYGFNTCKLCGHIENFTIEKYDHVYETKTINATCMSNGYVVNECVSCSHSYTLESLPILPHNFGEWYEIATASCETTGLEQRDCTECDHYETKDVPAIGHNYANGVCTNCGEDRSENCSCNCHKTGFMGFIWKILNFFYKIFKTNRICGCGAAHY